MKPLGWCILIRPQVVHFDRPVTFLKIDEHGNWTQRITVRYALDKNKKTKLNETTTVRKIEYFVPTEMETVK